MFENLDDPRKQMLLAMGLGLLGSQSRKGFGGFANDLSKAGLLGMNAYGQAKHSKAKLEEEEQQKQIRKMQMDEIKRGLQFNDALRSGVVQGSPASQKFAPDDQEMPSQYTPPVAGGIDFSKAMGIDPMKAIQAQSAYREAQKKELPKLEKVSPGESLVQYKPDGSVGEVYKAPDKKTFHYQDVGSHVVAFDNESKPVGSYPKGLSPGEELRAKLEIERIGQSDRQHAATLGQSERHFQQRETKPQLTEGPQGPAWVRAPESGAIPPGGAVPTGLGAKMPESQKKELQSLDAQLAIVDEGINVAKKNPKAFSAGRGIAPMLPLIGGVAESTVGKFDSTKTVEARAYVYNVVSKVINERAGAAQSAQELTRLRSFLPAEMDNSSQIEHKFKAFKKYLGEQRNVYSSPIGSPAAKEIDFSSLPK